MTTYQDSTTNHYHTLDLVNGEFHTHHTIDELDDYLSYTVTQDAREYLVQQAPRRSPGTKIGARNQMRVTVCNCDDAADDVEYDS